MRMYKLCATGAVAALLTSVNPANANTELPAQYDARSVGMAGTGSAFIQNGSSVFLNPAGLQGIEKVSASLSALVLNASVKAPFLPNQSVSASVPPAPFGYLGAGFRVHERIVLGAAVYSASGGGMSYEKVGALGGQDIKNVQATFEAQPAISVKILDNLSIGAGYRIAYMLQQTQQPGLPNAAGLDASMDGFSFLGAQAGILYKPIKPLALAFVYRSKMTAETSGSATLTPPAPIPALQANIKTDISTPHMFKLGTAVSLLEEKLTLSAEGRLILFADSHDTIAFTTTVPGQPPTRTVQTLGWNNAVVGVLGGEYIIADLVPVRAGISVGTSATPYRYTNQFGPPPGVGVSGSLGVGLKLKHWDFDLGGFYGGQSTDLANPNFPTQLSPTPGQYQFLALGIAASAGVRF